MSISTFITLASNAFAGDEHGAPPSPPPDTVRLQSASSSLPVTAAFAKRYFAEENRTVDFTPQDLGLPSSATSGLFDLSYYERATKRHDQDKDDCGHP
jgi:hypothetical protein